MIVSIHQPNYLPWAGFFHKLSLCDQFVLLDTVPFSKNSYQNRCKIKTVQGEAWLTVPVRTSGRFGQLTNQVEADQESGWNLRHWRVIEQNYRRAPHFRFLADCIEPVFRAEWALLADGASELIIRIVAALELLVPLIRSSSLSVTGSRSELLCAICKSLDATVYLSGPSGKTYLDLTPFREAGIRVEYHSFASPVYPQLYGEFIPALSVIDLLANCGPSSKDYLLGGSRVLSPDSM